ncbi:MAG TPA: ABC transporter ATP-binding protein [Clostridia bacterium]|nr:ABC transporter ATP-binding protein [Clostridia bacterium]
MGSLLEIKDLSIEIMSTRGLIHAVRGVNIGVEHGSIHGIVGESGCGKSVSAKAILQLHDRRYVRMRGAILFEGRNLLDLSEREMEKIRCEKISMIFQDPMASLNPLFTIGEQIAEVFTDHFGTSRREARRRALELLERVGILPAESRYGQYPFEFSGGMLQRVIIAIAIAANPSLIVADEPTTALDVTIQAQILELLQQLQRDLNISILIITHNFGIVSEICDHVSVMYAGSVFETGEKRDVFANPVNPYSRALIESIPKRGCAGQRLKTISGVPPELFNIAPGCSFAPRCELADERCLGEMPALTARKSSFGRAHLAACHNAKEE